MHMDGVSSRFDRSVDRTREHHIWTGAIDTARGTGRLMARSWVNVILAGDGGQRSF